MTRRLYFLFPLPAAVHAAVDELIKSGVSKKHMHALARDGVDITGLPTSTTQQRHNLRELLARLFWGTELAVFVLALAGLIYALSVGSVGGSVLALVIMAVSFLSGAFYAIRIPDTTQAEFREALAHGEVLLLVDVPRQRVVSIEDLIHRHHPSAVAGGSSWTIEALGI